MRFSIIRSLIFILTLQEKKKTIEVLRKTNKRKCSSDGRKLTKREREISSTSWSVLTRKKGLKMNLKIWLEGKSAKFRCAKNKIIFPLKFLA